MADEVEIFYNEKIEVTNSGSNEVRIKLTEQGPVGPTGPMGSVTPELIALRDDARASKADAAASANAAAGSKSAAAASATSAATSATNSANSASKAKTSETNAKYSESNAKASENASASSASAALASQNAAKTSETNSKTSETNAKASETKSKASENAAAASENVAVAAQANATASESKAKASETNAKQSETNAKISEENAFASMTAAATSEANAASSEDNAALAAIAAAASENAAATSQARSHESELAALQYKKDAASSETSASSSRIAAAASETAASQYADAALISANNAKASESAAKTSETSAKSSETNAKLSQTAAADSDTSAQNAMLASETAKTAAEEARDIALSASSSAGNSKSQAEAARNAAQSAKGFAEAAQVGSEAARDRASEFAAQAAHSAEEAAKFDPAVFPTKVNNGSDFADPDMVRENIGAQAKLAVVTKEEAEAGTGIIERSWTAERVKQAIAALAAAVVHKHEVSDINGLQDVLDGLLVDTVFSGKPSVPTPDIGDRSLQIANTSYVRQALDELVAGAPGTLDTLQEIAKALGDDPNFAATITQKLAGKSDLGHKHTVADITDLAETLAPLAPKASPAFEGAPTAPTQEHADNSTKLATTAHVKLAIANSGLSTEGHKHSIADVTGLENALASKSDVGHKHAIADTNGLDDALAAKAPLASPALSGTPTAPTQAVDDNSTKLATTAFVATAVSNGIADKADTGHSHEIADVKGLQSALDAKSPLASPTFSGTPKAPTAAAGTNTTQLATTAFVTKAVSEFSTNLAISGVSGLQDALDAKWSKDDLQVVSQTEAEAGTVTTSRAWSALRVRQAIDKAAFQTNTTIGANVNLNDIVAPGLHHQGSNANTSAALNYPVLLAGMLTVTAASNMVYQIYQAYSTGRIYSRVKYQTTWSAWIEFATADAPTFTGEVTLTGGVSVSGEVRSSSVNSYRMVQGSYGSFWRQDGGNLYLLLTNSGDQWGGFNSLRPFRVELATGRVTIGNGLTANDVVSSGNVSAYSDERLKSRIKTISNALEMVGNMRGVRYTMNKKRGIGVIAQEIQKIIPEVVTELDDDDRTLTVSYGNIVGVLIEAIKELKAEIDDLKRAAQ